jgi:hypothetical protein
MSPTTTATQPDATATQHDTRSPSTGGAVPAPPSSGAPGKVWTALSTHPGATTAEIAAEAGVSTSAANKALTALENDRLATRTPGQGKGRRRTPDTWTARPTPTTDDATTDDPVSGDAVSGQPARDAAAEAATATQDGTAAAPAARRGHQDENEHPPAAVDGGPAAAASRSRDGHQSTSEPTPASRPASEDQDAAPPKKTPEHTAPGGSPDGNAPTPKGGLRAKVAAWLAANLDKDITPGRLGTSLGHSSGAVANALATLARNGEAVQTREKPVSYAHPPTPRSTCPSPRPARPAPPAASPPAGPEPSARRPA